jgi:hypothetical protein
MLYTHTSLLHTHRVQLISGRTKHVLGFANTPDPFSNLNSRHIIAASDTPITESKLARLMSLGSNVSSTCLRCTTISSPHLQGDLIRSLSTIATRAPSARTLFTLHQNRSPRIPTLINVPSSTLGCLLLGPRTSNACRCSRSTALNLESCMLSLSPRALVLCIMSIGCRLTMMHQP